VVKWIKGQTISLKDAEKLPPEEQKGKILYGEFLHQTDRPGIVERYQQFLKQHQKE
jgi:glycine cleavage system regulatory protein